GVAGEVLGHLGGRLEEEVVGLEAPVVRVLERVAGLDAEERLVRACVFVAEVVDVAGRDRRQLALAGELDELREDAVLDRQVRVLQLDVDAGWAERFLESYEFRFRVGRTVLLERAANPSREASRERDQPLAVAMEKLPVDPRLVVV